MIRKIELMEIFLAFVTFVSIVVLAMFGLHWGALDLVDASRENQVIVCIGYWAIVLIGVWWLLCLQLLIKKVFKRACYIRIFKKIYGFDPRKAIRNHASDQICQDIRDLVGRYSSSIKDHDHLVEINPFSSARSLREREKNVHNHYIQVMRARRKKQEANDKMWDAYDAARYFRYVPRLPRRDYKLLSDL